MIGAIAGDIIGSPYEFNNIRTTEFPLFLAQCEATDDSILTIALAESLLTGESYTSLLKSYVGKYPHPKGGYGGRFAAWANSPASEPYNSLGNGSAMRVSPVGFAFDTLEEVNAQAKKSAAVTHNHPEGIKGAQAVAAAIFMARTGSSRSEIKQYTCVVFGYDLSDTVANLRQTYDFDETCPGTVPQAFVAFLESNDYEDAVRKAVSIGGDSDTIACIAGGIAQAFYGGVPEEIKAQAYAHLDPDLLRVVHAFGAKYQCS